MISVTLQNVSAMLESIWRWDTGYGQDKLSISKRLEKPKAAK